MKGSKTYFANIEILRFLAAFLIIVFHSFYGWKDNFGYPKVLVDEASGQLSQMGKLVDNSIHNINLGVELFFLISGFVITHILLTEKEKTGTVNLKAFFVSRIFRILPLFYFALAITPLYNYYFHEPTPDYLKFFFGLGNFELMKGWGAATINPMWTLCIEIQFYIAWAFALKFIPRHQLYKFFAVLIFSSIIYRAAVFHTDNWWMKVYMHTLSRMDLIAIGSIISLWYHNHPTFKIETPLLIRLMVYGTFLYVYINDDNGYIDSVLLVTVKKYFYASVIAFGFINYLFNPKAMFSISERSPLLKLGSITYGIYLFNVLAVALIIKMYHYYNYRNILFFYLAIIILSILFSIIVHITIEKPFVNLKNKVKDFTLKV